MGTSWGLLGPINLALLYYIVPYYTMLYYTILCYKMLYHTILLGCPGFFVWAHLKHWSPGVSKLHPHGPREHHRGVGSSAGGQALLVALAFWRLWEEPLLMDHAQFTGALQCYIGIYGVCEDYICGLESSGVRGPF